MGKGMLVGRFCAVVALAILAFKYVPVTSELRPSRNLLTQPVKQDSTTQPMQVVLPRDHSAIDWNAEFRSSVDYFSLIAKAAKAGLEGDGRAAYYVSRKWSQCAALASQYSYSEHPAEAFNNQINQLVNAPPEWIERQRRQFQECSRFYKFNDRQGNDVFANLPKRDGGYRSGQFWMDLAYQNNDPIAQTVHAAFATASRQPSSEQIKIAQADLDRAIASGDPEALFSAGMIITNGLYTDRIDGFALSLAACDLGLDCSASNRIGMNLPFGDCVGAGTCAPGTIFSDWVIKNLGEDDYARAYARAQQIKDALAQGDVSALKQFAKLKN